MGNRMIVISPAPEHYTITGEQFRAAAGHWAPHARLHADVDPERPSDATLTVERPGDYLFNIIHFRNKHMVSTDGTPAQAAEVAVWAINSFPPGDEVEVWLTDQAYSGHVVLRPGMTVEDVLSSWQDHE
jgi:hypothetical protein